MGKTPWLSEALNRFSSVLKMLLIGILILLFLIPLGLIRQIVQEREMSRSFAENQVMGMWGGEQTIAGRTYAPLSMSSSIPAALLSIAPG